jgi:uncharacterized C2H2 Zn-finger protein
VGLTNGVCQHGHALQRERLQPAGLPAVLLRRVQAVSVFDSQGVQKVIDDPSAGKQLTSHRHLTPSSNRTRVRSHGCSGDAARDWTSIDCPICQTSVKFTRAMNADDVWERHYLHECTKEATEPKLALPVCGNAKCSVRMALSNRLDCDKCGLRVCLKCRVPETHNCVAVARDARAKAASGRTGSSSSSSSGTKAKMNGARAQARAKEVKADNSHDCPFCSRVFSDSSLLVSHVNSAHGEGLAQPSSSSSAAVDLTDGSGSHVAPTPAPAPAPAWSSGGGAECPLCGRRFVDQNALISHASGCDGKGGPGPSDAQGSGKNNCRIT